MRKQMAAAVLVGVLGLAGTGLTAQVARFGPQIDFGTNSLNLGIGGRIDLGLAKSFGAPLTGVGSFDYFFGTSGVHFWEINANLFYNFTVPKSNITPYAGGGLDILGASCTGCGSSTSGGLNLGGGLKFKLPHSKMTPYVEALLQLHSGSDLLLTGGILF
ncbi:MAG TPA: hypothetical protein VNX15_04470 [Gemmatimonadales bacterium]|jgi:hypothetical protein|nr:hypothetical protein [Gemmatimonadales bacterium]